MCKCVLYYCHRVTTQLQLTNILYIIFEQLYLGLCSESTHIHIKPFCLTFTNIVTSQNINLSSRITLYSHALLLDILHGSSFCHVRKHLHCFAPDIENTAVKILDTSKDFLMFQFVSDFVYGYDNINYRFIFSAPASRLFCGPAPPPQPSVFISLVALSKNHLIFFVFEFPCIRTLYYKRNQQDATLAVLFISNCKITLHVSDAFCAHHQEY